MKRKQLLTALLLMALFAPWAANAQNTITLTGNVTQTIEPNTTYNFYDSGGPDSNYGTSQNYTATLTAVGDITINFSQLVTESSSNCSDYDYMLIYDGDASTGTLLGRGQTGCSTASLTTGTDYVANSGTMTIEWHSDGTVTAAGWAATITGGAASACPKPTNLTVSNLTSNSATVNWESDGNWFHYQYRESGEEEWIEDGGNGGTGNTFASLTEVLEPNTTYEFRVQNICNLDPLEESAYETTQFTTPCGAITTFPWTEDFESYEANTVTACWDNSASTSTTLSSSPYYIWGVYSYSNNKMLSMYNYFVQSGTALINTMPFEIPVDGEYQLAFDYSHRADCGAFKVKISTDGGTTFTDLQSYTSTASYEYTYPGTFTTAEPISLAAYAGQTVILQFYAEANYGSGAIFLDNVSISKVPTCPPPTGLTVSFTETGYRFSWDAESGYQFYYTDAPVGNDPVWSASYTTENYTDYLNHYLSYNEDWTFYLRKKCSEDDYSEPVSVTFHTKCAATTALGYMENFDGYTVSYASSPSTRILPDCWNAINTSTSNIYSVYPFIQYYGNALSGHNCLHLLSFYYAGSSSYDPQPQYAILPVMDDLGGVQVTLQAKGYNDASTFKLGTMTNPNDVSTFTAIYEQELTTSYQRFVYNIPANTTDKYLVFMIDAANWGRPYNGVYIDDIAIPTCSEPTGLEVLELTAHSVTIAWDAEGGDMFQEDFNTLSFDPNEPPTSWSHTADYYNQAHWDDLEPEHFYGIWVRKYCSVDDQSAPVYITFTTPEACPAPTGLQVVENSITSTGASFIWDAEEGASFEYFTISDPWEGFEPAVDQSWTSTQNNTVGWPNAFSPNEVVRFYLRKDCGSEGYSNYVYVEFRTACGPMSLADGYTENFNDNTFTSVSNGTSAPDGYPDVSLPYCWQFLNRSESTSTYPQAFLSSSSACAVSGNCLLFKSSSTTPLYAILPEFVQNISEYQLTFTYRNEGLGNLNGTLYVGYMTNPSDASTFVQTLACTQTTTMTEKTAYFPNVPQGSFMAFKYVGGTNDNCYLGIDNVVVSNGPSCFPTGTLSYGELSAHTAKLSWDLVDETQDAWVVEYSESNQFFEPVYTVNADTHENFVLTGLDAETTYYVRVRGNCGEGSLSDVSNTISFTTAEACPLPTNLVASNLTQNTADLSWTGSVDVQQYQVWFRRAEQVVGIDEQFNTNTLPDRWERKQGLLDNIMNGTANLTSGDYNWYMGTTNGVFDSHAYLNIWGTSIKDWLITPSHNIQSSDVVIFDLALTAYSGGAPANTGTDDRFVVLVTIDNGQTWTILREWNNSGSQYVYNNIAHTATGEQVSIDLTEYAGWDVRIAFYGESTERNANNNLHIDNVKIGTEYAAGGGNIVESQTTSVQLVGLEANMIYDVQVRSMCSDTWTDIFNFKTLDQNTKVFIGGQPFGDYDLEEVGDKWWNPNNWVPYGMPSSLNGSPKDDVILRHDAVIAHDFTTGRNIIAAANSITFEGDPKPTLTIEDGNQLWLNNEIDQPDVITVKKNIIGYAGTKDQYYLISSPVQWAGQYNPANGIVTTESDYDLYAFDPAASDGLEWRNYKADPTNFKMDWGTGYLYANAADVMISVTGPVMDNKQPDEIFNYNYYENEEYSFNGWKLCGNTFTCNAYLSSDSQTMAFYRMNAEGTGFEAVTSFIKPMEGFFLQNTVNGKSVVLSRTAPSKGVRCLNLVLSQVAAHRDGVSTGSTTLDNAIIRFDEGNTLEKLSFREGSSKVYIKQEGKDYAVVNVEGQVGEVPVSFVPESNGTYSLSFTSEEVSFSYLHLIDNLTGEDVDLLAGASTLRGASGTAGSAAYTFNARTTDYESRFRLVFATGSSVTDDTFGFVNASGNFCIFGIEGEATVQVIDVLGHVLSSEQFSGSYERHLNVAPGVYMIRLIQGNDVKVQKVVVR